MLISLSTHLELLVSNYRAMIEWGAKKEGNCE